MNIFNLEHAIESARAELEALEDRHFAAIKASLGTIPEIRARAAYSGYLDAKHATLALINTVSEYYNFAVDTKGIVVDMSGQLCYGYYYGKSGDDSIVIGDKNQHEDLTDKIMDLIGVSGDTFTPDSYRIVVYRIKQ